MRCAPGHFSLRLGPVLDPVIHPLGRLRVCAALRSVGAVQGRAQMRFAQLREAVGVSDSALSKQLTALERAGYVRRQRSYGLARSEDVVWVALTPAGLEAFESHLGALREIAGG